MVVWAGTAEVEVIVITNRTSDFMIPRQLLPLFVGAVAVMVVVVVVVFMVMVVVVLWVVLLLLLVTSAKTI